MANGTNVMVQPYIMCYKSAGAGLGTLYVDYVAYGNRADRRLSTVRGMLHDGILHHNHDPDNDVNGIAKWYAFHRLPGLPGHKCGRKADARHKDPASMRSSSSD